MATMLEEKMNESGPSKRCVVRWAAISGRWRFSESKASYLEPTANTVQAPVGIAIGSVPFQDGIIETTIRLPRNEQISAGVVFGFRSLELHYLVASIGGWDSAYSLGEYRPELGWTALKQAGSLSNLDPNTPLHLAVKVRGQSVEMIVNDVAVLNTVFLGQSKGAMPGYMRTTTALWNSTRQ